MAGLFTRLAERTLGQATLARARQPARFEGLADVDPVAPETDAYVDAETVARPERGRSVSVETIPRVVTPPSEVPPIAPPLPTQPVPAVMPAAPLAAAAAQPAAAPVAPQRRSADAPSPAASIAPVAAPAMRALEPTRPNRVAHEATRQPQASAQVDVARPQPPAAKVADAPAPAQPNALAQPARREAFRATPPVAERTAASSSDRATLAPQPAVPVVVDTPEAPGGDTIEIVIGRIDVRLPQPPAAHAAPAVPVGLKRIPTLATYLSTKR